MSRANAQEIAKHWAKHGQDPIKTIARALLVAVEALEKTWQYPNAKEHHTPDCELITGDITSEEAVCTCGYWATHFVFLKLEARDALAKIRGTERAT